MSRILCLAMILLLGVGPVVHAQQTVQNTVEKAVQNPAQEYRPQIFDLMEGIRFQGEIVLCGEKIPYQDPDVQERLEKEMMLSLWSRPQVILWLKRVNRYFPVIEKILKEENLPDDLKYVAVVESALLSHGRSHKGAVGYWQFLRSTGRNYGLRIDNRVDERRSIFQSTRAACLYFKALKEKFGSYLLAMAAYNMGEFGLTSEIEAQQTRSFFELYLPLETQRYVLKIAVAKMIIENPGKYGFHLTAQDLYPPLTYATIQFSMQDELPLSLIAQAANIPFKTLKDYNPEIRGYDLEKGKVSVRVPRAVKKGLKSGLP